MSEKQDRLIREEQRKLDSLIRKMDQRLLEYDERLTRDQLQMNKTRGWKEAYGAFIDAKYDKLVVKENRSSLSKSRNALYEMRIELECQDLDGYGSTDTEELKIGLHTYSNKGDIYIVSWKMPVCRYFMFNDNAVEYTGSVYQSKLEERYQ